MPAQAHMAQQLLRQKKPQLLQHTKPRQITAKLRQLLLRNNRTRAQTTPIPAKNPPPLPSPPPLPAILQHLAGKVPWWAFPISRTNPSPIWKN